MLRTQIYITDEEKKALVHLSRQTGKSQSELIREAIDVFCSSHLLENRLAIMQSVRGLWKNRADLPDFTKLRNEFDRTDKNDDKDEE